MPVTIWRRRRRRPPVSFSPAGKWKGEKSVSLSKIAGCNFIPAARKRKERPKRDQKGCCHLLVFLPAKKFSEASTPSLLSVAVKKHSGSSINIFPVDTTCQPSSGKVIQSAAPERREGFMRKSGNTFSGGGTVLFLAAERAEKGI